MSRKKITVDVELVRNLFNRGFGSRKISHEMGIKRDVVRRVLKELNIKHPVAKVKNIDDLFKDINKNGPNGCWLWLGATYKTGYGRIFIFGKYWRVHRIVYTLLVENIPDGLLICHKCDNPICCNPEHMFIGTNRDNSIDCLKKNRSGRAKINIDQSKEIIALSNNGICVKKLSQDYGISCSQVRRIIKGIAWTFKVPKNKHARISAGVYGAVAQLVRAGG